MSLLNFENVEKFDTYWPPLLCKSTEYVHGAEDLSRINSSPAGAAGGGGGEVFKVKKFRLSL